MLMVGRACRALLRRRWWLLLLVAAASSMHSMQHAACSMQHAFAGEAKTEDTD